MKTMDDLINDLKQDLALRKQLASLLVSTDPGCWSNMVDQVGSLGYQVTTDQLQQKVSQVAAQDSQKDNTLIQDWNQHVTG